MKKNNYTMYAGFSGMILTDGIEKTCEEAIRLGFSSVESFASTMADAQNSIPDVAAARQVKQVLNLAKLPVACHSVLVDTWRNANAEKELMKELEIAYELGTPFFHHTLLTEKKTAPGAPEYHEAVSHAVKVAAHVADYAKTLGITCIYENQGRYVNGVNGFGGFYHEMKKRCDNVGVCADLGNIMFVNEKPEAFVQEYIRDICHVHVKDYLWKPVKESPGRYWMQAEGDNWLRETMIGSGVIDFAACMKILQENDYRGAIALELWHSEPFEAGVGQAMQYIDRFKETLL